jgi:3-methyladenine DNA glycosylase AlkD
VTTKTPSARSAHGLADALERELAAAGTAERAEGAKRYLKSDLRFLGVDTPTLRRAVKGLLGRRPEVDRGFVVALVRELWPRRVFELRVAAVEILTAHVDHLAGEDLMLVEEFLRDAHTWALVDGLAPRVAGPLVAAHPALSSTVDRWAEDDDFWLRRAALLVDLVPLRRGGGDWPRFTRYADALLEDREPFIRKAIGWVLREVGKTRPHLVHAWLLPRAHRAAGLTVREAVKYLPEPQKTEILHARRP